MERKQPKGTVKMNKPGQHSIYVLPESVDAWESNGWTAVEDGSSETAPNSVVARDAEQKTEVKSQSRPADN